MTGYIPKDWVNGEKIYEYDLDRIEHGVAEANGYALNAFNTIDEHVLDTSIHLNDNDRSILYANNPTIGNPLATIDDITKERIGLSNVQDILNNYIATTDPLTSTNGYNVGSVWVNTSNNKSYICTHVATNANVWKDITASGSVTSGSVTGVHNDLTAIQGGAAGNYYHLTDSQHDALIAHLTDYNNPHHTSTGTSGYVTLDAMGTLERNQIPECNLRNVFEAPMDLRSTPVSETGKEWRGICWSPELRIWCGVCKSTDAAYQVMTSADGITWTGRTAISALRWNAICWASKLGLFIAVSANGTGSRVMTSPDGITWTLRTSPEHPWTAVIYVPELGTNGRLIAVANDYGTDQTVMTSEDGITWTIRTASALSYWEDVCWSSKLGLLVAVAGPIANSQQARIMTSPDGITWTSRANPVGGTTNNWGGVCWSPTLEMFVAVAYLANDVGRVMTSTDGINWTLRNAPNANQWYKVIWANELRQFVACSITGTGNRIMYSRDGINWSVGQTTYDVMWYAIGYSPQLSQVCCTAITGTSTVIMTSPSVSAFEVDVEFAKIGKFDELYSNNYTVLTEKETYKSISAAYTATVKDRVLLCTGTFTITLPLALRANGIVLTIKNLSTGTITIDGYDSETIDGATTKALSTQWSTARIICNGTSWFVI